MTAPAVAKGSAKPLRTDQAGARCCEEIARINLAGLLFLFRRLQPKYQPEYSKSELWYLGFGFTSPPPKPDIFPGWHLLRDQMFEWRRKPITAKIFTAQATCGLLPPQASSSPRTKVIGSFAGLSPEKATSFWPWQILHLV